MEVPPLPSPWASYLSLKFGSRPLLPHREQCSFFSFSKNKNNKRKNKLYLTKLIFLVPSCLHSTKKNWPFATFSSATNDQLSEDKYQVQDVMKCNLSTNYKKTEGHRSSSKENFPKDQLQFIFELTSASNSKRVWIRSLCAEYQLIVIHTDSWTNYQSKNFALRLVLKKKLRATRKWRQSNKPVVSKNKGTGNHKTLTV